MCPSRPLSVSYFNNQFIVLRFRAGVPPVTGPGECNRTAVKRKFTIAGMTVSAARSVVSDVGRDESGATGRRRPDRQAKGIHDRVIKLDTHNDIDPSNFTPDCNYTMRLTTQVNLPKMVEGDMDVTFMIAYVGQGPLTPEGYESAYSRR